MTNIEAIEILKKWYLNATEGMTKERLGYIEGWFNEKDKKAFELAIKALGERPIGHWIEDIHEDYTPNHDTWECSNCGEPYMLMEGTPDENKYNYCPNCGARMGANNEL